MLSNYASVAIDHSTNFKEGNWLTQTWLTWMESKKICDSYANYS